MFHITIKALCLKITQWLLNVNGFIGQKGTTLRKFKEIGVLIVVSKLPDQMEALKIV